MIDKALLSLRPNAQWNLHGDDYDGIEWIDTEQTKPTKQEIEIEIEKLMQEYVAKEYQRQRALEYPSFADQFDLLYHGGYEAWKSAIDTVKNKYPKGTA